MWLWRHGKTLKINVNGVIFNLPYVPTFENFAFKGNLQQGTALINEMANAGIRNGKMLFAFAEWSEHFRKHSEKHIVCVQMRIYHSDFPLDLSTDFSAAFALVESFEYNSFMLNECCGRRVLGKWCAKRKHRQPDKKPGNYQSPIPPSKKKNTWKLELLEFHPDVFVFVSFVANIQCMAFAVNRKWNLYDFNFRAAHSKRNQRVAFGRRYLSVSVVHLRRRQPTDKSERYIFQRKSQF